MNSPRHARVGAYLVLVIALVLPHPIPAALITGKKGIAVATAWFDGLPWPDLRE